MMKEKTKNVKFITNRKNIPKKFSNQIPSTTHQIACIIDPQKNYPYFIIFNKIKRICEIWDDYDSHDLIMIIDVVKRELPNDYLIWKGVCAKSPSLDRKVRQHISVGFRHPHLISTSLLGHNMCNDSFIMGMYQENRHHNTSDMDKGSVFNEYRYVIEQSNTLLDKCMVKIRFSPETIRLLRSYVFEKGYVNGKQNETGGAFFLYNVDKNLVHTLSVDQQSIDVGDVDSVDVESTRYNFHSHPKDTYTLHSVKNGWPSSNDFTGFVNLSPETVMHAVATKEGVYLIKYSKTWRGGKPPKSFLIKNYDIPLNKDITEKEFVQRVNNIKYGDMGPIFHVEWSSWDQLGDTIFNVFYKRDKNTCVSSDEKQMLFYGKK